MHIRNIAEHAGHNVCSSFGAVCDVLFAFSGIAPNVGICAAGNITSWNRVLGAEERLYCRDVVDDISVRSLRKFAERVWDY